MYYTEGSTCSIVAWHMFACRGIERCTAVLGSECCGDADAYAIQYTYIDTRSCNAQHGADN